MFLLNSFTLTKYSGHCTRKFNCSKKRFPAYSCENHYYSVDTNNACTKSPPILTIHQDMSKNIDSPAADNGNYESRMFAKSIQRLVGAGFSKEQSLKMVESLDRIAQQKASELEKYYLTATEYDAITKVYNSGVERFFIESQSIQKAHDESVRSSYANLSQSTANVNSAIFEETKGLESGVQLDINLEKKKTAEGLATISDKASHVDKYLESKVKAVKSDLTLLEKNAKFSLLGIVFALNYC